MEDTAKSLGENFVKAAQKNVHGKKFDIVAPDFKAATDVQTIPAGVSAFATDLDRNVVTAPREAIVIRDLFGAETISGNALTYLGEGKQEGFTKVESEDGYVGYISDKYIKNIREMTEDHTSSIGDYTTVGFDGKINMVFHQTTSQASNNALANSIANVTGVNVIAPTWFFPLDGHISVKNC